MVVEKIFNFFFPDTCALCSKNLYSHNEKHLLMNNKHKKRCGICNSCVEKIPLSNRLKNNQDSFCNICSRQLLSENETCTICRKRKYYFNNNFSLWDYKNNVIKSLIHSYKFKNRKKLAFFFVYNFYLFYEELFPEKNIVIIPAPCSSKRIKKYGWDHMKNISHILEKYYSIKTCSIFFKKKTRDQKELGYEKRQTELQGKIIISHNGIKKLSSNKLPETVVLIDDVFTTGATSSYCSLLLKEKEIKNIIIITIALD